MNEFDLLRYNGFVPVDRAYHFHAIQINDKLSYEYKKTESGMEYCIIRNILKNPDDFMHFIKKHPAFGGSIKVSSPGFRQLFSPIEFNPIMQIYSFVHAKLHNVQQPTVNKWVCCSNIYYDGMTGNPKPHNDGTTSAANLWLSNSMYDAGTAFYKMHLDGKTYYNSNELTPEAFHILLKNARDQEQWYAFDKDEHWEKYDIIPAEYNSAVIYNGQYFHNAYYDPKKYNEHIIRYSFVSFLQP